MSGVDPSHVGGRSKSCRGRSKSYRGRSKSYIGVDPSHIGVDPSHVGVLLSLLNSTFLFSSRGRGLNSQFGIKNQSHDPENMSPAVCLLYTILIWKNIGELRARSKQEPLRRPSKCTPLFSLYLYART